MRLLYNPENGAPIKDMVFKGPIFVSKEGETFLPGDIVKVPDDVADFVLGIYGFVEEVDEVRAKKIQEDKKNNTFKCDECDYAADSENKLKGHRLYHAKKAKIDAELGVKVIKVHDTVQDAEDDPDAEQKRIDAQANDAGLIGEGLVKEDL